MSEITGANDLPVRTTTLSRDFSFSWRINYRESCEMIEMPVSERNPIAGEYQAFRPKIGC